MTELRHKLHPKVSLSQAADPDLPLPAFQVLVVVEPDPESWMPKANTEQVTRHAAQRVLQEQARGMEREVLDPPVVIWLGGLCTQLFEPLGEVAQVALAELRMPDYTALRHLIYFMRGLRRQHPAWQCAVVGATLEDDVVQAANALAKTGWTVTLLARYCVSLEAFEDLDALAEAADERQRKDWLSRLN